MDIFIMNKDIGTQVWLIVAFDHKIKFQISYHNIPKHIITKKKNTWFFTKPQTIAACEGRGVSATYFRTPLELGRLDSSKWSDMSKKRRAPISLVISKRFTKAALVTASNWAMPDTTTCGFSFLINSIISSDWRGASMTVSTSSAGLSFSVCYIWYMLLAITAFSAEKKKVITAFVS